MPIAHIGVFVQKWDIQKSRAPLFCMSHREFFMRRRLFKKWRRLFEKRRRRFEKSRWLFGKSRRPFVERTGRGLTGSTCSISGSTCSISGSTSKRPICTRKQHNISWLASRVALVAPSLARYIRARVKGEGGYGWPLIYHFLLFLVQLDSFLPDANSQHIQRMWAVLLEKKASSILYNNVYKASFL